MYGTGRTLAALAAALGLTLSLAACNGGSDHPRLDLRAQKLIGGSAAPESAAAQSKRLETIMKRADHVSVSDVVGTTKAEALPTFHFQFGPFDAPLCENTKCAPRNAIAFPLKGYELREAVLTDATGVTRRKTNDKEKGDPLPFLDWASSDTLGNVGKGGNTATFVKKNGVTISRQTDPHNALGGVLKHSGFASFAKKGKAGFHTAGSEGGMVEYTARYGVAGGDLTESRPVRATWTGVMVGHAPTKDGFDELLGTSTITYDVGARTVDVGFAGIKNLTKERAHAIESINAPGLAVSKTGTFAGGNSITLINGAFYGPDHAESAGTIYHRGNGAFTGAFGAKRQ